MFVLDVILDLYDYLSTSLFYDMCLLLKKKKLLRWDDIYLFLQVKNMFV